MFSTVLRQFIAKNLYWHRKKSKREAVKDNLSEHFGTRQQ